MSDSMSHAISNSTLIHQPEVHTMAPKKPNNAAVKAAMSQQDFSGAVDATELASGRNPAVVALRRFRTDIEQNKVTFVEARTALLAIDEATTDLRKSIAKAASSVIEEKRAELEALMAEVGMSMPKGKGTRRTRTPKGAKAEQTQQLASTILAHMKASKKKEARNDIMLALRIPESEALNVRNAIRSLIDQNKIEQIGAARGAAYKYLD